MLINDGCEQSRAAASKFETRRNSTNLGQKREAWISKLTTKILKSNFLREEADTFKSYYEPAWLEVEKLIKEKTSES